MLVVKTDMPERNWKKGQGLRCQKLFSTLCLPILLLVAMAVLMNSFALATDRVMGNPLAR